VDVEAGINAVAKTKRLCPCRVLNPSRPARSLDIVLTELARVQKATTPRYFLYLQRK